MGEIKIREIGKINAKNPILVIGMLGVGGIGIAATLHLIKNLEMDYVGYIDSEKFYPTVIIRDGIPMPPVRIYSSRKHNIIAIVSELVIPTNLINKIAKLILKFAAKYKVKRIYSFGGLNIQVQPEDIDKILGIGTTKEDRELLEKNGVMIIKEGVTTGLISSLLSSCYERCFPGIFLFTPSRKMTIDFLSAAAILNSFSKIENIKVNTDELVKEGKEYEEKVKKIMETIKREREEYKSYEDTIYR
ncbi:MAG: PAC2 family protein [Candidatus Micrarchaeia archaeon]